MEIIHMLDFLNTRRITIVLHMKSLTKRDLLQFCRARLQIIRSLNSFIFSTNKNTSLAKIKSLINKNFYLSHGQMVFNKEIHKFPIIPHLTKFNKNFIYIGDSLKSIHPVAGQGWNLGVKDIQTLHKLIDQYSIESELFNSIYYSRRIVESFAYLGFTSLINMLYENQNNINSKLIKLGYKGLQNIRAIRGLFIKQAMGRLNLVD